MTIQELAMEWLDWFEEIKRDDETISYCCKTEAPVELHELIREVHGDMLPDDYKYEFIVDALEMIADYDGDDIEELAYDIEADYYDNDLLNWLNSHSIRSWYVDEAVKDVGHGDGIMQDIALGQVAEKREVFDIVFNALSKRSDEYDDDEYDDE